MIETLKPDMPEAPGNIHGLTTLRRGGVSCVPFDDGRGGGGFNLACHVGDNLEAVTSNRQILRQLLPSEPVWLNQVHGTTVVDAADVQGSVDADASVTKKPGVICCVMTADCLPVLFYDQSGRVVGAAHAGWRGLLNGVLENTVAAMRDAGGVDIGAWLGPAIGPQQFEVGREVEEAFGAIDVRAKAGFKVAPNNPEKFFADLYFLARLVLNEVGVERISGGDCCTVTDAQRFYSYRRDGRTGRMASMIWFDSQ